MWLSKFSALWPSRSKQRRKPASTYLLLETLEDRAVPAFLAPVSSVGGGALTVADLNHDGRDDVVAITSKTTLSASLSKGDGTFLESSVLKVQNQTLTQVIASDINGDGHLDIKAWGWNNPSTIKKNQGYDCILCGIRSVDQYVNVWLGHGDGTFGSRATTFDQKALESSPYFPISAVADFNRDGILDRAAIQPTAGANLRVYLGSGGGVYQPAQIYSAGSAPRSVATGDFNGDGWIDLIVTNQLSSKDSYTLSVLLNDGSW